MESDSSLLFQFATNVYGPTHSIIPELGWGYSVTVNQPGFYHFGFSDAEVVVPDNFTIYNIQQGGAYVEVSVVAQMFGRGGTFVFDPGVTTSVPAPVQPVPEPGTAWAFAIGVIGLIARRRRI